MKTILKSLATILISILSLSATAQVKRSSYSQKKLSPNVVVVAPPTKQATIKLEDINEWLCPKALLRGDREFDGNGPKIKCEVEIRLSSNGREIWADIKFWAQETVHDWSTTQGTWTRKVYDAPYGKAISKIVSNTASRTEFVSQPAGFQFLVPGADVHSGINKFFEGHAIPFDVLKAHGVVPKEVVDAHGAPLKLTGEVINNLVSSYFKGNTVYKVPSLDGALVKFFHIVGDTGGNDISDDDNCNDDTRIEKIEFFPLTVEFK